MIPVLRKQRQVDHKPEGSLGSTERPCQEGREREGGDGGGEGRVKGVKRGGEGRREVSPSQELEFPNQTTFSSQDPFPET